MDLPNEILEIICHKLDFFPYYNLLRTCKLFYNRDLHKDIFKILDNMNYICDMNISNKKEKIFETIEFCTMKSYTDIIKILASEISQSKLLKYAILACNNDLIYVTEYYHHCLKNTAFEEHLQPYSDFIVRNNRKDLLKIFFKDSATFIWYILNSYAKYDDYDNFVNCFNLYINLCNCKFASNGPKLWYHKDDNYYCFFAKDIELQDDWTIDKLIKFSKKDYKCNCFDAKKISTNLFMESAIIGKSHKIVKFLIDQGNNDYNNGLCYAINNGNLEFIDYFVELGATINDSIIYNASRLGHLHIFNYLYNHIKDISKFRYMIDNSKNNPLNYYNHFKTFNREEYDLAIENAEKLGWYWCIEHINQLVKDYI